MEIGDGQESIGTQLTQDTQQTAEDMATPAPAQDKQSKARSKSAVGVRKTKSAKVESKPSAAAQKKSKKKMAESDSETRRKRKDKSPKHGERSPSRKRHHHHRHKKRKEEDWAHFKYDMPGVFRIVLNEKTQADIGLVVGTDVSSEVPWKTIRKEVLTDHIELIEDSELAPLRLDIIPYVKENILMGYIPDEIREYDEFYIVLSEKAEEVISNVIVKLKEQQEAKLNRALAVHSKGYWRSYGSEKEVDETIDKNNRSLLEVEIETAYPIISPKVQFRSRPVAAVRDGYAELLQTRNPIEVVSKKRVDLAIQVTPSSVPREAQTNYAYPKNVWTQYEYEFEPVESLTADFTKNIKQFVESNLDELCDKIRVNDCINLYTNDYVDLITDEQFAKVPDSVFWDEYLSFSDLADARNKMITNADWHPMLTGTIAISYADRAPNTYLRFKPTSDHVNAIVHGKNPVLIWCFNDALYPKLQLECPRPPDMISFCPFNPDILVGGLSNGQIVVWDIKNRLEKAEEEEILTQSQQKYRVLMWSLMGWFKNVRNNRYVRVTAISDVAFSHDKNLTRVTWFNPFRNVLRTGIVTNIEEDEPSTMQLMSSSIDGSLLIWNMLAKAPAHAGGDYRPQRKPRRLKERPAALTVDVSPFRVLNRLWRPTYKIAIENNKKKRVLPIASSCPLNVAVRYQKVNPKQPDSMTERVAYEPVLERPTTLHSQEAFCGTSNGYVYLMKWSGYEVDPGETVNCETAFIKSIGRYHDGPVHTIDRNVYHKTTFVSIGGRVFAIWRDDFPNRPIFWRKSRIRYLHGHWAKGNPSILRLSRRDGSREVWSFLKRSDKMLYEQNVSGERVLGSYVHQRPLPTGIIGIADNNGALRMFFIPHLFEDEIAGKQFADMLDCEVSRKKGFLDWQNRWLENNRDIVEEKREQNRKRMEKMVAKEVAEQRKRAEDEAEKERLAQEAAKKNQPQPGRYLEWTRDQWRIREEERMKRVLFIKKQLNPELLITQQKPLKKIEAEEEKKRRKQKQHLANADKLFTAAVATMFPDVIKVKPPPPVNPYEIPYDEEQTKSYFDQFTQLAGLADDYLPDHPFAYTFDWKKIVQEGIKRRSAISEQYVEMSHKERLERERAAGDDAARAAAEQGKVMSRPSTSTVNKSVKSKSSIMSATGKSVTSTRTKSVVVDEPVEDNAEPKRLSKVMSRRIEAPAEAEPADDDLNALFG